MSRLLFLGLAIIVASPAVAQQPADNTAAPGSFATSSAPLQGAPVKRLLADGYEVKAGFADATGGAYMVLQKATSAYLCHSNPTPNCEKLN